MKPGLENAIHVMQRDFIEHHLEDALQLAAFSVVCRPLALEELLRQIQRMMMRIDRALRGEDSV